MAIKSSAWRTRDFQGVRRGYGEIEMIGTFSTALTHI
jgi:hypothetical protein